VRSSFAHARVRASRIQPSLEIIVIVGQRGWSARSYPCIGSADVRTGRRGFSQGPAGGNRGRLDGQKEASAPAGNTSFQRAGEFCILGVNAPVIAGCRVESCRPSTRISGFFDEWSLTFALKSGFFHEVRLLSQEISGLLHGVRVIRTQIPGFINGVRLTSALKSGLVNTG
jgi:hypothetical protein